MVQQEGLADATGARRWREGVEIVRSICEVWDRGVKVRSLAEAETQWTRYLEADEGSPEAFFGQVLVMFVAWVADQEFQSARRRGAGAGPRAGEGPRTAAEVQAPPGGDDAADAGQGRQPPADCCRLRVLGQHGPEGAAAGGGGLTWPILTIILCNGS